MIHLCLHVACGAVVMCVCVCLMVFVIVSFCFCYLSEGDDAGDAVSINAARVIVNEKGQPRVFDTDAAYDRSATNEQIYNDQIEPIVQRVLSGYNSFVVTYGAGRTGKSFTFLGSSSSVGLIDQASDALFQRLESQSGSTKAFVTISVFDVYNAMIIDLLNPNTKTGLNLLEHRSFGCLVENVAELECTNTNEVKSYVKQAMAVHDVLELRMTNQLGKPHTFIDLHIELIENDNPSTIKFSTLRFCSPAGSGGVSLKFNQGLQALNKVVDALASEKESWNIPYASSRLTRLLEPGLGGNAFTLWITNLDSSERSVPETCHSLEVGEKLKKIKNTIRVNKNTIMSTIRELREEIKKARGKLQLTQPGTYMHDIDPQQLKNLKQLITELERIKSQTWDKKRQRSIAFNETRRISLESEGLLYTLLESGNETSDVPEQMLQSSKTLLTSIVSQKALCDDSESEVAEKRNLFKLRCETVKKKLIESGGGGGVGAATTIQDLVRSDEKLQKLERSLNESDDKYRSNQLDLTKMEEEYRKLLTKISTIEAKQRKIFLMGKDAAGLERLNKSQEWSTMKRDMDTDRTLNDVLSMIHSNTESQKSQLQSSQDVGQLKDAAINTLESLRETTEQAKRLEWERDALWGRLIESQFKNEVQMTRYQEHMFFVRHDTHTRARTHVHSHAPIRIAGDSSFSYVESPSLPPSLALVFRSFVTIVVTSTSRRIVWSNVIVSYSITV